MNVDIYNKILKLKSNDIWASGYRYSNVSRELTVEVDEGSGAYNQYYTYFMCVRQITQVKINKVNLSPQFPVIKMCF